VILRKGKMADKKKIGDDKKGFVWYGMIGTFWIMIAFHVFVVAYSLFINPSTYLTAIFDSLKAMLGIITYIFSIIYLIKYQKKGFAAASLVISTLIILSSLIDKTYLLCS